MLVEPYRNAASVERAAEVFRRFAKAKKWLYRTREPATVAMGIAAMCSVMTLIIARGPSSGLLPAINLTLEQGLAGLFGLVLLNGSLSWPSGRWGRARPLSVLLACLPWVSLLIQLPADSRVPDPGNTAGPQLRKSYLWRRLESSMVSLFIRLVVIFCAFVFLATGFAMHPAGSVERSLSHIMQAYAVAVGTLAAYRCEKFELRGRLSSSRQWPVWPYFLLPWGFSIAPLLILGFRTTPSIYRETLATTLFFDRRGAGNERWTSERELLPRLRQSESNTKGLMLDLDSLLRTRVVLLMLQMVAVGIWMPLKFVSLWIEVVTSFAATTLIVLGFLIKNRKLKKRTTKISPARAWLSWGSAAIGSGLWGLLIGSSCGLIEPTGVAIHLYLSGLWGGLLAILALTSGGIMDSFPRFWDVIWLLVLGVISLFGWLTTELGPHLFAFEPALLWGTVAAWVLALPIGLAYQHLFFEPFHIRDLWRRDLPVSTRRQLLPVGLALVLPLGGLANAVLALAAQERDERLQLWWEHQKTSGGIP